jgi:phosphoglucosamine mutase
VGDECVNLFRNQPYISLVHIRSRLTVTSISGIRGIIGQDLNAVDYVKIGQAFGELTGGKICAVGRDTRSTGTMAANASIAGLLGAGCVVFDLGIASTPAVFREVRRQSLDGGLIVSASHNPPEWNGVKFVLKGGRGLFEEDLNRLMEFFSSPARSFKAGQIFPVEPQYSSDIVDYVGNNSCAGLNIVLDLGGGAGSLFAPKVFRELGCRAVTVNASAGVFTRDMDPTRDSLEALSDSVRSHGADLGLAYDCDADRVVFMSKDGEKLPADYTILIYLKHLVDHDAIKDVVVSIDTSSAVEEMVEKAGGRVVYSKVGEANVVRRMLEQNINIGGEGSSGGLILSDFNLCRDGLLASALVAKAVHEAGSVKSIVNGLPKYHSIREKIQCSRKDALQVVRILSEEEAAAETIDGVKIRKSDRSWILVRPSNTEDIVRLSVEARTKPKAADLMKRYLRRISLILQET